MKAAFDIFIRIMYIFDNYLILRIFFTVVTKDGGFFLFWFVVRFFWNLFNCAALKLRVFKTFLKNMSYSFML